MILFVNACVRSNSGTKRLADHLLSGQDERIEEVNLETVSFPQTDKAYLNRRDELIANRKYDDPMFRLANQFAKADKIVIAAPYWDLSFPASLKQYFEHINVIDITFTYTADGKPKGLCKAKELYYVMTAGGIFVPLEFGFGYVKTLCSGFYGIPEVKLIAAKGLDIDGADVERIMADAIGNMSETVRE